MSEALADRVQKATGELIASIAAAAHHATLNAEGPFSAPLIPRDPGFGDSPGSTPDKYRIRSRGVASRSASDPTSVFHSAIESLSRTSEAGSSSVHSLSGTQAGPATCKTDVAGGFRAPTKYATASTKPGYNHGYEPIPPVGNKHDDAESDLLGDEVSFVQEHGTDVGDALGLTSYPCPFPEAPRKPLRPTQHTSLQGPPEEETAEAAAYRIAKGFSANYHGNIFIDRNKSADVPESENCSVFLTGLPTGTTIRGLLEQVVNCGRVYACHINPPDVATGHMNSAAKIVFFDAFSTQKFIHHCTTQGLRVGGKPVRAIHNRIKSCPATESQTASRVLLIYGPAMVVNPRGLTAFFSRFFSFEVDCIISHGACYHTPECALVEYRFGSYRCQAQLAKRALRKTFAGSVDVFYGEDPCALPSARIPNERFLWDMFWGTKISARAMITDMAEQQAVAAATARMAAGLETPVRWAPPSGRQFVYE